MRDILCLVSHYLPGHKAGGALRSVANLAALLRPVCSFRVFTSDRDLGDDRPYDGVRTGEWTQDAVGTPVYYAMRPMRELARVLRSRRDDILYLNSFFDFRFSIWPMIVSRSGRRAAGRTVIAPRGEFSPGALRLKQPKKRLFVALARRSSLYRGVIWHASTELEADDIRRTMGPLAQDVRIATDVTAPPSRADTPLAGPDPARVPLTICFVSRISPKKNLAFALEVLRRVAVPVRFHVYGPVEDAAYLAQCRAIADGMPAHVTVSFERNLEHAQVAGVMARHHLFLLPTLGENFGHVIAEALGAGTPALISDQTPWRNLQRHGVGWDLALDAVEPWAAAIHAAATMDDRQYAYMRRRAAGHTLHGASPTDPRAMLRLFMAEEPRGASEPQARAAEPNESPASRDRNPV